MILCIDLGTDTGYALRYETFNAKTGGHHYKIESGIQNFAKAKFDGGGMRFVKFRRWLESMQQFRPITEIYFEAVRRHIGVDAAHIYGGLMATLTSWCEEKNIPYAGVDVGTIKKHIAGSGRAKKHHVIEAVSKLGFNPKNDDEADAIAILSYVIFTHYGEMITA